MADPSFVNITVNINSDFDPDKTVEELIASAAYATKAVALKCIVITQEYISNWDHPTEFLTTPVARLGSGTLATFFCTVITGDDEESKIFQWVSMGVDTYSFVSGTQMRFPYVPKTRYMSYTPKTGTGLAGSSRDLRTGRWRKTNFIDERDIRRRDIPDHAYEGRDIEVLNVFLAAMSAGYGIVPI